MNVQNVTAAHHIVANRKKTKNMMNKNYTIPGDMRSNAAISNYSFYIHGQNPWVWNFGRWAGKGPVQITNL